METVTSQIKINLPLPLKTLIKKKADKYGLTLASYTKFLMVNDLEEDKELSEKIIASYKEAKKNKKKFIEVKNIDELFDKL
jgi:hypothetical protein